MEMKERQRWTAEEDALLCAYVKKHGPREWNLIPERMKVPLNRDAKSCLERWMNYLKPGLKKGSLTEEEQRLVIQLQAKYGNKWKKIAAEMPGRTAKRLGKWWEVFKEKKERERRETTAFEPHDDAKYDKILESFAEKLVGHRPLEAFIGAIAPPSPPLFLPWAPLSANAPPLSPATASVTPYLSHPSAPVNPPSLLVCALPENATTSLLECCKELDVAHNALMAMRRESTWRLRRVELQMEAEKWRQRRGKMEEIGVKVDALIKEREDFLSRIEEEYEGCLRGVREMYQEIEENLAQRMEYPKLKPREPP